MCIRRSIFLLYLLILPLIGFAALPFTPSADDLNSSEQDRIFMARAYELAQSAVANGDHPFAAVLVKDGEIIYEFENTVYIDNDVTLHAELALISTASRVLSYEDFTNTTLYSSTEPCIMCCGAIHWAGIRKIVYGTSNSKLTEVIHHIYPKAAIHFNDQNPLEIREIFERLSSTATIIGPLMEEEGIAIHTAYWPNDKVMKQVFKD